MPTARSVYREQDGPCYQAAEEAQSDGYLQVSEQEEAVERLVVEDITIRNLVERFDPVEQSARQVRRSFSEKSELASSRNQTLASTH